MRRCDENIVNMFLFKTNFKTLFFLREYRRERSEFDVGPGLKFINIYIQVVSVSAETDTETERTVFIKIAII